MYLAKQDGVTHTAIPQIASGNGAFCEETQVIGSTDNPPEEEFEELDYSDGLDPDHELLEADPDDVKVASKRDKSAWRRIEQRSETECLRRELADWDEYAELD